MIRLLLSLTGAFLILAGFPLFWTPIPVGLVMMLTGLAMLISNSEMFRKFFRSVRQRNRKFDQTMRDTSSRSPEWVRKVLDKTLPD